ncbi:SMC-Scp complex subunit ScpB [Flocculibacter collagenilyticus]|uniref:SMC-Scp complex subunit ScpB n=1 Tax=Flocculibacter collagenilyticus TaxID=2744479 RepID=UPI0018F3B9C6|nr:SMC-Scp complex subunit ScpB [Flocculibacter collagenilyticus]
MATKITDEQLKQLIEAAIFVSDTPQTAASLKATVLLDLNVSHSRINKIIKDLELDYVARGINLVKVASGYRFQSNTSLSPWLSNMWQEKAPKYSRALLETLSLIAYKQPITRGEIENIRGVSVSSTIIKTLIERDWIKVIGHKEVPGKPALYATTNEFLNYFSLQALEQLPELQDVSISDLNSQGELTSSLQQNKEYNKEEVTINE